jgi:hypothetical protein
MTSSLSSEISSTRDFIMKEPTVELSSEATLFYVTLYTMLHYVT